MNPKPWLGIDWSDVSGMDCKGAIVGFRANEGESCIMFLVQLGNGADKHELVTRWIANHGGIKQFQATKLNDATTIYNLKKTSNDTPDACIAIGSEWTCISSSSNGVDQWIQSASSASFRRTDVAFHAIGPNQDAIQFWISPWSVLRGYAEKNDAGLFRSAKLFGLDELGEISGSIQPPSAEEANWQLKYQLQLKQPLNKGLAMFSFKSGPATAVPTIANTSMNAFTTSYVDIKPWFQGINHAVDLLIDEETPGSFGDLLDSLLTDPEGPKLDVRKELVYRIGPKLFNFGANIQDQKNPDVIRRNQVWAFALQDSKQALNAVTKLFEKDDEIKSEVIGQYKSWCTVNDESLFVSVSKGENQALSVAAIDDSFLYLATDTPWFQNLLRNDQKQKKLAIGSGIAQSHFAAPKWQTFSLRQQIDLSSWMQSSWDRLPEKSKKNDQFQSIDFPALIVTVLLVPDIPNSAIPVFKNVRQVFGTMTHASIKTDNSFDGQLWLDEND